MNQHEIIDMMDKVPVEMLPELYQKLGWAGDYTQAPGKECKTIPVSINNTSGLRTYMQPDSVLDRSVIKAIEFIDDTTSALNPSIRNSSGDLLANPSASELAGVVFAFRDLDQEIAWVSAYTGILRLNGGKYLMTNLKGISWQDCYIYLTGAALALPVVTLRVWYDPDPADD